MKSKVLSLRLPIDTIVGVIDCHLHIAKRDESDILKQPLSTLICLALQGWINPLRRKGYIPNPSEEECLAVLSNWNSRLDEEALSFDSFEPPEVSKGSSNPIEPSQKPRQPAASVDQILKAMDSRRINSPVAEVSITLNDNPDPIQKKQVDFSTITRMAFQDLLELAPEDPILLKVSEQKDDGDLVLATELVYSRLSQEEWGTDNVRRMIATLYKQIVSGL